VLRRLAKMESDARIARRILSIANALDGMSRDEAPQSAGMDRQTLRDWVIRYNEHGLDGLADRERDGRPPKLNAEEKAELICIVLAGPDPEVSGFSPFTREDLVRICKRRFGKSLDGPYLAGAWTFATKGAALPPAKGPGRAGGL
jgi:transposase